MFQFRTHFRCKVTIDRSTKNGGTVRTILVSLTVFVGAVSARGDLFSSDFDSLPTDERWELVQQFCEPET